MAVTGPEAHPLVLILAASVVLQTQMAASGSVGSEALNLGGVKTSKLGI